MLKPLVREAEAVSRVGIGFALPTLDRDCPADGAAVDDDELANDVAKVP